MHASSYLNMRSCRDRFLDRKSLDVTAPLEVLDLGGADVNGSYAGLFQPPHFAYHVADIGDSANVTVRMEDPYRIPLSDDSVDLVISGQAFEHIEFFWLTFAELVRITRPGGLVFLIAPSAGPIHRYPVDCYRFYPDAFRALAKWADCALLEVTHDLRGPWNDLVGVFAMGDRGPAPNEAQQLRNSASWYDEPATFPSAGEDEEGVRGEVGYLEVLAGAHRAIQPELYAEIGVRRGDSLRLAGSRAVGIDPTPCLERALPPSTRVVECTSSAFFRGRSMREMVDGFDMALIDGLHLFEAALEDFMNLEKLSRPWSLIVVDDIFPNHPIQAVRDRRSKVWTGDVWKLHHCLIEQRKDLTIIPVDSNPTGLLLVAGLDARSTRLWKEFNPTVRRFQSETMRVPPEATLGREGALSPRDPRLTKLFATLKTLRERRATLSEARRRLAALGLPEQGPACG